MRIVFFALASFAVASLPLAVQAKPLTEHERYICKWGSGMAGEAQAHKLAGVSRYGARSKIQARKFERQWMRTMALRISEQTYDSESRLKPASVRQIYYDGCIRHELARR